MVSEQLLNKLVQQLTDEHTLAIMLTGSHARGDATSYSDIDIVRYVHVLPPEADRYGLRYEGDTLISLTTAAIYAKREELAHPDAAIWAVEGLRQAKILYDPQGEFAALQAEAQKFVWDEAMQGKANQYVSRQLVGYAEEAHKILNGLVKGDTSAVLYGAYSMVLGVTTILLVHNGVLLKSENEFFSRALAIASQHPGLADAFALASGYTDMPHTDGALPRMRGLAALEFYAETATLLKPAIEPEHLQLVEKTASMISDMLGHQT